MSGAMATLYMGSFKARHHRLALLTGKGAEVTAAASAAAGELETSTASYPPRLFRALCSTRVDGGSTFPAVLSSTDTFSLDQNPRITVLGPQRLLERHRDGAAAVVAIMAAFAATPPKPSPHALTACDARRRRCPSVCERAPVPLGVTRAKPPSPPLFRRDALS